MDEILTRLEHIETIIAAVLERLHSRGPESPRSDGLASKRDAAAYLGISVRALESRLYSGELGSRVIGKRRLVPWPALREYAKRDHPRIEVVA